MKQPFKKGMGFAVLNLAAAHTLIAQASVESSLTGLKDVLLTGILPIIAVIALGYAGLQFFTGNPNAKQHFIFAITGIVILFIAQGLVDLLSRVVR